MSGVEKDIIPYGLYVGIRENLKGINLIGMKRKGLNNSQINNINVIIKKIFNYNDSILNNIQSEDIKDSNILGVKEIIEFINQNSKRGLCILENE